MLVPLLFSWPHSDPHPTFLILESPLTMMLILKSITVGQMPFMHLENDPSLHTAVLRSPR